MSVKARIVGRVPVTSGMFVTDQKAIAGVVTAAAYTAGDAVGTITIFEVPERGTIHSVKLIDIDDDTLSLTVHVFRDVFTPTADNAALNISLTDLFKWVTSIDLTVTKDLGAGKVAEALVNSDYIAPNGKLYVQTHTAGTPTIAAGQIPLLQFFILPAMGGI